MPLVAKGCGKEGVKDMALPDPLPLTRANQATLNPSGRQKVGIAANLGLSLWKIEGDELIE